MDRARLAVHARRLARPLASPTSDGNATNIAAAIDKDDIGAATAGTLHRLSDAFFVGAELAAILLLVAVAVVLLRTRVLPKWWAYFGILIAIVLVIGPIGWAALIFGLPVWTIGTSLMLLRSDRPAVATASAPA